MTIPSRAGVGLKPRHYHEILDSRPDIGWFEVHAENYMGAGGPPHHYLERIRADYPLSLHGVGLSIGGDGPLDKAHLTRLKSLVDRYQPGLFSEHLAWSSHGGVYFNDLLPIPYTDETLENVCEHIDQVQDVLGMRMLLENPSSYLSFETSTMSETSFLAEVAGRTGCGLLLDVNNVMVSATNLGWSPAWYLEEFPMDEVGEVHLGGHREDGGGDGTIHLIDAHDGPVSEAVWTLYADLIARIGTLPTLIEWDDEVPDWPTLFREARTADRILDAHRERIPHAAAG